MVHDISSHDVLEPLGHLRPFVVASEILLTEDDTQPWLWLHRVVQLVCPMVYKVCTATFKFICPIEVKHACQQTHVIIVHSVDPITVGAKIMSLTTNILTESEPNIQVVHFPFPVKCFDLLWNKLFNSFPQECSKLWVV